MVVATGGASDEQRQLPATLLPIMGLCRIDLYLCSHLSSNFTYTAVSVCGKTFLGGRARALS